MPREDGYDYEFIRKVRRLPPTAGGTTPAIALTAYPRSEDEKRALGSGFQVHLTKPVSAAHLATAIAQLMIGSRLAE